MHLIDGIVLDIFSMVILVIMLLNPNYKKEKKISYQDILFITMLAVTAFCLFVSTLSKFEGYPNTVFATINQIGNFLIFASTLFVPTSWFLYVHYQIFQVKKLTKKLVPAAILINVAYFLLTVLSRRFGWFYIIDENNIYQNGPFFELYMSTIGIIVFFVGAMIVRHRKKLNTDSFFTLLFIPIIPLICVIIQMIFTNIPIMLNGAVVALLLTFVNVQNKRIETDYLTGIYNRSKIEKLLENKIKNATEGKTFSAILFDLNGMKYVNDTFGHSAGDELLINFAKMIKNSIDINDFSARISGDEFCVVLDTGDIDEVKKIVEKIERRVQYFNEDKNVDYKVSFSKGYSVYNPSFRMTNLEFLEVIDKEMYKDKMKYL